MNETTRMTLSTVSKQGFFRGEHPHFSCNPKPISSGKTTPTTPAKMILKGTRRPVKSNKAPAIRIPTCIESNHHRTPQNVRASGGRRTRMWLLVAAVASYCTLPVRDGNGFAAATG